MITNINKALSNDQKDIALNATHAKALVIVESPTKAKTIRKFLGDQYRVEASMGHVRDLPSSASEIPTQFKGKSWARIGVNVDDGFKPLYVVPKDKKTQIKELKDLLKGVEELYIATDEDREGESIGWHLIEVLKPKVPVKRMVFHEITESAIQQAISTPRDLDINLVQAQETRRVLDRLVGYVVSPQLWKKVASKLSAGRVQSAAVKLLVNRERERMSFHSGEWWDIAIQAGISEQAEQMISAQLVDIAGKSITQGSHFDAKTGLVLAAQQQKTHLLDQTQSEELLKALQQQSQLKVVKIERKESQKKPLPPFITSTLQQAANKRLGWSTNTTMKVAQRLYENGHITYMRTDAPALAKEAVQGIRAAVERQYGSGHLPPKAIVYRSKAKNAQEAHEAIRPSGTQMKTASQLGLSDQDAKLYTLIWRRTMACQMSPAKISYTNARITSETEPQLTFRASGKEIIEPGFMLAYEIKDEDEKSLPPLSEGQTLSLIHAEAVKHLTKAPARYSEASLVKALEQEGVGRPSTYASIIDTIQRRGYVRGVGRQLIPTFTALAVTQLLENAFSKIVDPEFTASMEEELDQIATGGDHLQLLQSFYQQELIDGVTKSEALDPKEICAVNGVHFPEHEIRVGRFGPFIEYLNAEQEKTTLSLPNDLCPDEVNSQWITERIAQAASGEQPIGYHPENEEPVYIREGRFGTYLQLGEGDKPKRSSLPKGMSSEELSFDQALFLLDLPKVLGEHPETGSNIQINLGRYGAYAQHQKTYASLANDLALFTVNFDEVLALVKAKEAGGGRGATKVLKSLGEHPEGGELLVYDGRYGPYVKYGKINASLPKGTELDQFTIAEALALLEKKASSKKSTTKKASSKKSTTKKSTTKKSATKKSTTKKSATKEKEAEEVTKKVTTKKAPAKKAAAKKAPAKKTTPKKTPAKKATKKADS